MWEPIQLELPPDLAAVTTTVWRCQDIMLVGVMRNSFLRPPVLWGRALTTGFRNLRKAPELLSELQCQLFAPLVYAEVLPTLPRNQALLKYLGFTELPVQYERKLYERSL